MLNLRSPITPDFEQYEANIKASGAFVYLDYNKYVKAVESFSSILDSAEYECTQLIKLASVGTYTEINKDSLIRTLVDYCGLNDSTFLVKSGDGHAYSVDQSKVLIPLRDRLEEIAETAGEGKEFALRVLDSYLMYAEYKTLVNTAIKKIGNFKESDKDGWFGKLKTASFIYEQQSTGRYYTKQDNLQNWNLNMVSSITCPKDYVLFWCDLAQIDLRVAYHIMLREAGTENDKIYYSDTDKYRAIFKIMNKAEGTEPDLELFKKYRPHYKKAVLSAIYNATQRTLAQDIHNADLAARLKSYVDNNPGYKEFRKVLDRVIHFGIEVPVVDYFGVSKPLPIPASNDKWARNTLVSQACNKPIQTTSNSVLMFWLDGLLSRYESYGFDRQTKVVPVLIRHDEAVLMVHKDVIKDHLWVLGDCLQIAVDDWDLLELEVEAGLYYKEPQQEFVDMLKSQMVKHASELTSRTVYEPRPTPYRPVSDVIEVYTYTMNNPMEMATFLGAKPEQCSNEDDSYSFILETSKTEGMRQKSAQKYISLAGHWVLYSSKLNKYKCVKDLGDVIELCKAIDSKFMVIYNTTKQGQLMYDDIYIKIDTDKITETSDILYKMESKGFPTTLTEIE